MTYQLEGEELGDFVKESPIFTRESSRTELDTPVGAMKFDSLRLKPGLFIFQSAYMIRNNVSILGKGEASLLEIQLNLSGNPIFFKDQSGILKVTPAMSCNIAFLPADDNHARIFFKERNNYNTFDIHIPVSLLDNYAGESKLLDNFLHLIRGERASVLSEEPIPINAGIYGAVQQMKSCPFEGLTRRIFLESKVLELIAMIYEGAAGSKISISKTDVSKMQEVAFLIRNHLDTPLTIVELAKKVGMNQTKLKIAFKEVFGNTIFGYLQEVRMNEAKRYLSDKKLSIQEISLLMGYSNVSNFSAAFKNRHGLSPLDFRQGLYKGRPELPQSGLSAMP
ncbi:MAG: AraC family transcriptional regulator [Leadbetterella sp.]|nr:AraC family transcriptional regulator [Leadbetterella sp.]